MDPLLFLTTDKLSSPMIGQWLLLNSLTSLYCLFTEMNALLDETHIPGSTLHVTREAFSTNFASLIHCPSFQSQSQKESSKLKLKACKHEMIKSDHASSYNFFSDLPSHCLLNGCISFWARSQKPFRKMSASFFVNCFLSRKFWFRKSIIGTQLLLLQL